MSSTSVYSDKDTVVTEATLPNPNTESGKQLLQCEKLLQDNSHFETTILRFGGLIGEDRNPIHFLAGRSNIENPDDPCGVNKISIQNNVITIQAQDMGNDNDYNPGF